MLRDALLAGVIACAALAGCGGESTSPDRGAPAGDTPSRAGGGDEASALRAVRGLQAAIVAKDPAAVCSKVTPELWKAVSRQVSEDDATSCTTILTAIFDLPGSFSKEIAVSKPGAVALTGDARSARVNFTTPLQDNDGMHPWAIRLRWSDGAWRADRVCALQDVDQDAMCIGSTD